MAGAFSGHMVESFSNTMQFGQPATPSIVTSGAMMFDSGMHGCGTSFMPKPLFANPFNGTIPEDSANRIATLQAKLNKKLGPEYISQRPGPAGGPKLTYAEGWKIINLANEVFGFNGWSSNVVNLTTDFVEYSEESRRYNVGVTAILRVTLRDGTHHEDVGYGMLENSKSKAAALDKCKKEAVTDALKRTLRNFGNLLGNCLYDKAYAQEVVKIKVPPAKFDKSDLYRRPEFEEKPNMSTTPAPAPVPQAMPEPTTKRGDELHIKPEPQTPQGETPMSYVPRHLRQEIAAAQQLPSTPTHKTTARESTSGSRTTDTPPKRGPRSLGVQKLAGLNTPIQTPPGGPPMQSHAQYRQTERHPLAREAHTERKASFSDVPPQVNAADDSQVDFPSIGDGEDSFHINSEDDAFLAAVDLGEGDLGRPIYFEEGLVSTDILNDLMIGGRQEGMQLNVTAKSPIIEPAPAQLHGRANSSGSSLGGSSDSHQGAGRGVTLANAWSGLQSNAQSSNSSTGQHILQFRNGQVNSVSTSSTVAVPLSVSSVPGPSAQNTKQPGGMSMGGLNLPPGMKPPFQKQVAKPIILPLAQRAAGNQVGPSTNVLKRNVDIMQGSSSSRPPMQGMGLARQQQQDAGVRRQPHAHPDISEGGDTKKMKR
ncbi:hypothetical protein PAXRUDRAFT_829009 [Paxillus rubicundulus Ve08.2h10]|uniref:DNA repair protein RAD52 n=1 Tax=Paxillus rubicundulus Ve08.2h10 TaxID=930991 RepID=A0A0D0DVD4_9AGAM|nr:hypothetical protein PAXRUDRAFT_829009 [Paxillus rubicundulus Ve08.2h10]